MNTTTQSPDGSGRMFDAIAQRYDLLNRINSLGLDRSWRRRMIEALSVLPGHRVLDLATGTADLPIMITEDLRDVRVVGLDPSKKMLDVGREKVARSAEAERIELVEGDAQALQFADASFDRATMAFGIRNVPDRDKALAEIRRVLVPGGRVAVLELSEPKNGLLAAMARLHVKYGVPAIGALLSSHGEYKYLRESIEAFDSVEVFCDRLTRAGLIVELTEPLTFGACVLYVARRPEADA